MFFNSVKKKGKYVKETTPEARKKQKDTIRRYYAELRKNKNNKSLPRT